MRKFFLAKQRYVLTTCLLLLTGVVCVFAVDSDNDGMSDAYELFFGLNTAIDDAVDDYDNDYLSNFEESIILTDPFSSDTDGDLWEDDIDSNAVSRALIPWGDPQFTLTNNRVVYTWPSWMVSAWAIDGAWHTNAPFYWESTSEDGDDIGSLNMDIDRSGIGTNNLLLALNFFDHTNSSMYIDLYDTNDVVTATNLYGNLSSGTDSNTNVKIEVPFAAYPSAVGVHLRKGVGQMTIYRALLYIDADFDGLDADQEAQLGTSDHNADTDGDGISDYDEVFIYDSDPTAALTIDNAAPSSSTATNATLAGTLTNDGGASTTVYTYWGQSDGGTTKGSWDHVITNGVLPEGAFDSEVDGLLYGIKYYYRCYATNAAGEDWADATTNFVTACTWTPEEIDTAAWYDASDASTVLTNGTSVTNWLDKSGNGYDLAQGNGSYQPTITTNPEGLNVLRFDGVNDILSNTSYSKSTLNLSWVYVMRVVTGKTGRCFSIGRNSQNEGSVRQGSNGGTERIFGSRYPENQGIFATGDTTSTIISYVKTGTANQVAWMDGTQVGSNLNSITTFTSQRIDLGGSYGYRDNVEFAEIVVPDSALSDSDRQKLEGYLAHKWGLTANLPAGHPYKTLVPQSAGTIANTAAANVTSTTADLMGTLTAPQAVYTVRAYYSTNNNANSAAWLADSDASSVLVGTYTDVTGLSVTGAVSSLSGDRTYYYTMMASNACTTIWASSNVVFATGCRVANSAPTSSSLTDAVLAGNLMSTGASPTTVYTYWGENDGGTTKGSWGHVITNGVLSEGAFASEVDGLLYGIKYYYRCYATNSLGDDWADATTNFVTACTWTPAELNTAAWYDAADASTITESSGAVSQWDDKSGNGRNVTQGTGSAQPAYGTRTMNGLNVLDFDGGDFLTKTAFPMVGSEISIFMVAEVDAIDNVADSLFSINATKDFQFEAYNTNQFDGNINCYGASNPQVPLTGGPFHGPSIYNVLVAVSGLRIDAFVDGTQRGDGGLIGGMSGSQTLALFADRGQTQCPNGAVAEVVVVSTATTAERQKIEGYLAWKWGIEGNLPSDHPYKTFAPGRCAIANTAAENIVYAGADLCGTLFASNAVVDVSLYWGPSDGGTNMSSWANSKSLGSFTNVFDLDITGSVTGLATETQYYYTLCAANAATNSWATPSQTFLTGTLEDFDADGMPDAWEITHFGSTDEPSSGDCDNDGLTNLQEYQNGTNPLNTDTDSDGLSDKWELDNGLDPLDADSDDDGVSDAEEIEESLTDPLTAEFDGTVTDVDTVNGSETNGASGVWQVDGTEIVAKRVRGYVEYTLTAPSNDCYRILVEGTHDWLKKTCSPVSPIDRSDLLIYVDGQYLGKKTLVAPDGIYGDVRIFTPYITTGDHTVRIFWENVHSRISLRVKKLRLQSLGGSDSDSDGVKDWVEVSTGNMAGLDATMLATNSSGRYISVVSPACLEGSARYIDMMSCTIGTNVVQVNHGVGERWYVDADLSTTGSTAVNLSFLSNAVYIATNVTWTALDLLEADESMTVRKDDSLMLNVEPAGETNGTVWIDVVFGTNTITNLTTTLDQPVTHLFDTAGSYTVTGTFSNQNLTANNSITVDVVEGEFPTNPPSCLIGTERTWACSNMPDTVVMESDSTVDLAFSNNVMTLTMWKVNKEHYAVARISTNGPILASTELVPFWAQGSVDSYFWVIERYEDSALWQNRLIFKNLPDNVDIQITIYTSGVTLDDSTTERWITSADLDELGQYDVGLIVPNSANPAGCHRVRVYQDGVYLGEAYYGGILMPNE